MTEDTMLKICQNAIKVKQSFFLSPADVNAYIKDTITGPPTTPQSYIIEVQSRTYSHNRQHFRSIHRDTAPIPRHQHIKVTPFQDHQYKHSPISGPPSTTSHHNIPVKPSKPSHIPTLKCPASSGCIPTTSHQVNN